MSEKGYKLAIIGITILFIVNVIILFQEKSNKLSKQPCILPRNDAQMLGGYETIPQI